MDDLSIPSIHQLGSDQGRGNLLGIEPYMVPQDYVSTESFFNKLNSYLRAAQREQFLNAKTIVLFPEHIGTWLVLAGENEKTLEAKSLASAERKIAFQHLLAFIASLLTSTEKGRAEAAFFRVKAQKMTKIYQNVFSQLAREHLVTIIAGSIVLPAPEISGQRLILNEGRLYNTSAVYGPDGIAHRQLIRKAFPTARELPFTAPASAGDLPFFDTPAGRLGVLICADSWYPQAYAALNRQRIDLLAVPSSDVSGMQRWNQPWQGYDGWEVPLDVDGNDIGRIAESQAWYKYSLAGRIRSGGAVYGMNIFLRGKLWDQDWGGWPATLVKDGGVFVEEQTRKAAILSLWL